ncbi:MAG: hypothetical protein M3146_05585 [Thermoproteota archaeon]|nr:hypothetical protein [Thermoproteota archaeon]
MKNRNISVLFLTFMAFLIVGSAILSFQTANAQNMTVPTGNATTADNATGTTGAENATGVGSISGLKPSTGSDLAFWGRLD